MAVSHCVSLFLSNMLASKKELQIAQPSNLVNRSIRYSVRKQTYGHEAKIVFKQSKRDI